jgi:quercetin dioxygenase-like cupin family protein
MTPARFEAMIAGAARTAVETGRAAAPIIDGEIILQSATRDISILVARDDLTLTRARYSAGQPGAGPHLHHHHTDAFYVLECELTFEIGRESKTVSVSAGGFVAVPPGVVHSFRTGDDGPALWLTIHAHDGGFASFVRGLRDGVDVQWDIAAETEGGGLPASVAIVTQPPSQAYPQNRSTHDDPSSPSWPTSTRSEQKLPIRGAPRSTTLAWF